MQATTSPKAIDLKPAALALVAAALFAGGIILGSAMDIRITSTTASVAAPAQLSIPADRSYNVESAQLPVPADRSYNRAQSGVTVDTSPTLKGRSGYPSTQARGITAHDKARGAAGWWASAPATTVAGTPVSQADPNSRYGGGIR